LVYKITCFSFVSVVVLLPETTQQDTICHFVAVILLDLQRY